MGRAAQRRLGRGESASRHRIRPRLLGCCRGLALGSSLDGVKLESAIDENGAPLLLVAGASVVFPTKSGNPAHQVGSGRFGSVGRKTDKKKDTPPTAADGSEQRRRDAVVD